MSTAKKSSLPPPTPWPPHDLHMSWGLWKCLVFWSCGFEFLSIFAMDTRSMIVTSMIIIIWAHCIFTWTIVRVVWKDSPNLDHPLTEVRNRYVSFNDSEYLSILISRDLSLEIYISLGCLSSAFLNVTRKSKHHNCHPWASTPDLALSSLDCLKKRIAIAKKHHACSPTHYPSLLALFGTSEYLTWIQAVCLFLVAKLFWGAMAGLRKDFVLGLSPRKILIMTVYQRVVCHQQASWRREHANIPILYIICQLFMENQPKPTQTNQFVTYVWWVGWLVSFTFLFKPINPPNNNPPNPPNPPNHRSKQIAFWFRSTWSTWQLLDFANLRELQLDMMDVNHSWSTTSQHLKNIWKNQVCLRGWTKAGGEPKTSLIQEETQSLSWEIYIYNHLLLVSMLFPC